MGAVICFEFTEHVSTDVGVYSSLTDKSGVILSMACAGQPLHFHPMREHMRSAVYAAREVDTGDAETVHHLAHSILDLSNLNFRTWLWSAHPLRDLITSSYLEHRDLRDSL